MPYRAPAPPVVSAPGRWARVKRGLARLHPDLCAHRWFRRWVGGRWAECREAPARMLMIVGASALEATDLRWRQVDECPHGRVDNPDALTAWVWLPCTCEVWP